MKLRQLIVGFGLLIVLLAGAASLLWWVASSISSYIDAANPNVAAAIIGTSGTIIVGLSAVLIAQFYTSKRTIADAHRDTKTAIYGEFIAMIQKQMDITRDEPLFSDKYDDEEAAKDLLKSISQFQERMFLWASPNVIQCWLNCRVQAEGQTSARDSLLLWDGLIRAMRKDLGQSNYRLKKGDLVKMMLKDPTEIDRS